MLSNEEMVLYLQFLRLKHGTTDSAFGDFIKFISLIIEDFNGPLSSLYKFDKMFKQLAPSERIDQYFFCSSCFLYYIAAETPLVCRCGLEMKKEDNNFIYSSLKASIKYYLETYANRQNILQFLSKKSSSSDKLTDIVDSKRYQDIKLLHRQKHGLITDNCIPLLTICVNADGVTTFKSSSKSTYPVMVVPNEICPSLRGFSIIVPLIFIATKSIPFCQEILTILVNELKSLEEDGVKWAIGPERNETTFVYTYTLCLDAPVKSKLLKIPGHSSKTGCPEANCRGVWVPKGKSGAVVYPDPECGLQRSSEGSKSVFTNIPALKETLHQATSLDSLHGIYIGSSKYITNQIFFVASDATERKLKERRVLVADNLLSKISPPSFIERFRLLGTESVHFKAHEWRNFLFYYSMPIMLELCNEGLIQKGLVSHWFNLVLAISLLNQEEISSSDIEIASEAIKEFVGSMSRYYGDGCCTYNIHLLLHLPSKVAYLGPLWATSMFKFESYNRTILNSFHGQRCIGKQIAKKLSQRRAVKLLYERVESVNPKSPALHQNMFARKPRDLKLACQTNINTGHVGCISSRHTHVRPEMLTAYYKVAVGRIKLTTYLYELNSNRKKKNCFVYGQTTELFGRVVGIYHSSESNRVFVVFESAHTDSDIRLPHAIFNCVFSSKLYCEILEHCEMSLLVRYKRDSVFYISRRVNNFENS